MDLVHVVCGSKLFIEVFYLYGEKEWGKYFWNQAAKKSVILCFYSVSTYCGIN